VAIESHGVSPKVRLNTGITYSMTFAQLDACIAAGLDVYEWFYGFSYTRDFKALVIAWHSLKGDIGLHVEDARHRKQRRK
jgi:hypothetical protein